VDLSIVKKTFDRSILLTVPFSVRVLAWCRGHEETVNGAICRTIYLKKKVPMSEQVI
jgi:hypothetical protein